MDNQLQLPFTTVETQWNAKQWYCDFYDFCIDTWYEASVDYDPCFENSVANLCDCTVEEYYITINGDKTPLDVHTYAACAF